MKPGLASRLSRFYSIRSLVALATLALVLLSVRPEFTQQLDRTLFGLGQSVSQLSEVRQARYNDLVLVPDPWWQGLDSLVSETPPEASADARSPLWWPLAERLLLVVVALYLILALTRLSAVSGFWLTLMASLGLVAAQTGLWIFKGQWWPAGVAVQLLVVGYLAMQLWLKPQREIQELQQTRHELGLKLATQFTQQQRLDQALEALEHCFATDQALALCYEIAVEQEKKRQYSSAIRTYETIMDQTSRFRDVKERLEQLRAMESGHHLQETGLMAKTMAMPASSGVKPVLGRYEIQRELGRGAMGVVYLGKDPKISRLVAIKTLNYQQFHEQDLPDLRERFFREAEAAGRLNHPNIVMVYDVGEEADLAYIAMDFVQGSPLDRYCRADELLPVATVYALMAQVADALEYAHERQVIHRDIKPSNLLYNPETEQVKVSDFGIARISDESKTRTGQVMGSPLYMSPEQLKGKSIKATSDLYSLSATFYQLLTGTTPFRAETLPELSVQIMNKKHRSVRDVREDLPASAVRITNKGLQKDPAKRFQSAAEMAAAIRKALVNDFGREVA